MTTVPPDLLLSIYPTLEPDFTPTGSTCKQLLAPHYNKHSCPECPLYAPSYEDTCLLVANPPKQASLTNFQLSHPEYFV